MPLLLLLARALRQLCSQFDGVSMGCMAIVTPHARPAPALATCLDQGGGWDPNQGGLPLLCMVHDPHPTFLHLSLPGHPCMNGFMHTHPPYPGASVFVAGWTQSCIDTATIAMCSCLCMCGAHSPPCVSCHAVSPDHDAFHTLSSHVWAALARLARLQLASRGGVMDSCSPHLHHFHKESALIGRSAPICRDSCHDRSARIAVSALIAVSPPATSTCGRRAIASFRIIPWMTLCLQCLRPWWHLSLLGKPAARLSVS